MKIRSSLYVHVHLGELTPHWKNWCVRHDATPAEGLRRLVAGALAADEPQRCVTETSAMRTTAVGEPRTCFTLGLTVPEMQAVRQHALALGFTRTRWIVSLVRAQLAREPQLCEQEMVLLAASNQTIASISRSLAQAIREPDRHGISGACGSSRALAEMKSQLDDHLRTVAQLLRANIDRWSR
jgi:hypothetical protein